MTFYNAQAGAAQDYGNPFDVVYDNSAVLDQALYEGSAQPGTLTSVNVAQWRIRKFFYDANNNCCGWRWADGTTAFTKDWSKRATYTYTAF